MRRAMKTKTPNPLFLIKIVWQSVKICIRRQGVVKCRVKHCHMRHPAKQAAHLANPRDIHWIVQRGEWVQCFKLFKHFLIDNHRLRETLATMNDPMRHQADFANATNHACFLGCQFLQYRSKRVGKTDRRQVLLYFSFWSMMHQPGTRYPYTLDHARGSSRLIGRIIEAV